MAIYRFDGNKVPGENTAFIETPDLNGVWRQVYIGESIELSQDQVDDLRERFFFTIATDPPPLAHIIGRIIKVYGNPADSQVITWDAEEAEWMPRDPAFSGDGSGLPSGGSAGQVLTRTSSGYAWSPVPAELPSGGTGGYVLARTTPGNVDWIPIPAELPPGGNDGDVLIRSGAGTSWVPQSGGGGGSLPSGGSDGDVLVKSGAGAAWQSSPDLGTCIWGGSAYPTRPDRDAVVFIGPSDPGVAALANDFWLDTNAADAFPFRIGPTAPSPEPTGEYVWFQTDGNGALVDILCGKG